MFRRSLAIVPLLIPAFFASNDTAPSISVYFSPQGNCTEAIVREIADAKKTIRIQAYFFTAPPISKAILDAHKRGVKVEACIDKSNQSDPYSSASQLKEQGIDVQIDAEHTVSHSSVMIVDESTVITGSFDCSIAAEEMNLENLLIIKNASDTAKKYLDNWKEHRSHCKPYSGAATTQPSSPGLRKPQTPPTQSPDSSMVYVTGGGKKYHSSGCRYLKGAGSPVSLADAKTKGKTPCKVCHPPS